VLYNNSDTAFKRHVFVVQIFHVVDALVGCLSFSLGVFNVDFVENLEELSHAFGVGGVFCSLTVGLGRILQEFEGDGTIFVNVAVTLFRCLNRVFGTPTLFDHACSRPILDETSNVLFWLAAAHE
jgi:hypothetical protein